MNKKESITEKSLSRGQRKERTEVEDEVDCDESEFDFARILNLLLVVHLSLGAEIGTVVKVFDVMPQRE